jgi:hypothetical protein
MISRFPEATSDHKPQAQSFCQGVGGILVHRKAVFPEEKKIEVPNLDAPFLPKIGARLDLLVVLSRSTDSATLRSM